MRAGLPGAVAALLALLCSFPLLPVIAPIALLQLCAAVLLATLAGFLLLRHGGLAIAVALAPLPGLAWGLAAQLPAGLTTYAFAVAAGLVLADAAARAILEGMPAGAARRASLNVVPSLALAIVVVVASLLGSWRSGAALGLCALSAAILLPVAVTLLRFDEDFFTRANRAKEAQAWFIEHAAGIAEPRWSVSLSGVALVLAALAVFARAQSSAGFWPAPLLFGAVLIAWRHDLRMGCGAAAAGALLALYAPGAISGFAVFAFLTLRLAAAARTGWRFAIESEIRIIVGAGLAAALVLLPAAPDESLATCAGLVAALVFFPAFSGALGVILPRRRDVGALYRA